MTPLVVLLRRAPAVAVFTASHIVIFTIVGLLRDQVFLWIYLPALAASIAIVVWIDHRWGPIPAVLLWLLSTWAAMHLAGGLAADPSGTSTILYGWWLIDGYLRYDQVVHGFGIGAATAVLAFAARDTDRPLVWGFVLSQVAGVVNETAENLVAVFVENTNVGDWVNTTWDIIWHLVGALIAVMWMGRYGIPGTRRGETSPFHLEGELE